MSTASVASPVKRAPLGAMLALAAIGLGIAGYLTFLHYALMRGDIVKAPACGSGGGFFDCHLVALSTHALFAGRPLAAWGALLYAVWIVLAVVGWNGEPQHRLAALRLITATALAAVLLDGYLAWLMLTQIHAVCTWCVATYAVNLLVLLVGWQALHQAHEPVGRFWADLWLLVPAIPAASGERLVPVLAAAWCLTAAASIWGVTEISSRLIEGDPNDIRQQLRTYVQQQHAVQVPVTDAPSRGSQEAPVSIVEFSDLLCPACQRAAMTTKAALANHPRDIRIAFKHYPLDGDCNPYVRRTVHPFACRVATAASCAHAQNKFWALHDLVLADVLTYDVHRLEAQARQAGLDMTRWNACLADGTGLEMVKRDIETAQQFKVQSTPTFFINGYMFAGGIPPPAFEIIMQEFLQHKTQ